MSLDVSKMIKCDVRFDKVLRRIIKDSSCKNVYCGDCPFSAYNHINNRSCSRGGGFNDGATDISSPIIINHAKFLLEYINKNSLDINKI